jgi:hypothetical protein
LAQRSRKRRPSGRAPASANGAGPERDGGGVAAAPRSGRAVGGRRLRGEERDAAIRAQLEPLEPGERPRAITVAAIVAVVLAIGNIVVWLAGWKLGDREPSTGGALAFPAIMLVAAVAMWHRVYWAVLGFQALLAITMVVSGLSLLLAANVAGALVSLAILVPASVLFWYLIRAMARLRLPAER